MNDFFTDADIKVISYFIVVGVVVYFLVKGCSGCFQKPDEKTPYKTKAKSALVLNYKNVYYNAI